MSFKKYNRKLKVSPKTDSVLKSSHENDFFTFVYYEKTGIVDILKDVNKKQQISLGNNGKRINSWLIGYLGMILFEKEKEQIFVVVNCETGEVMQISGLEGILGVGLNEEEIYLVKSQSVIVLDLALVLKREVDLGVKLGNVSVKVLVSGEDLVLGTKFFTAVVNTNDGALIYKEEKASGRFYVDFFVGDSCYVANTADNCSVFHKTSHSYEKLVIDISDPPSAAVFDDYLVYIGTAAGGVMCYDIHTGDLTNTLIEAKPGVTMNQYKKELVQDLKILKDIILVLTPRKIQILHSKSGRVLSSKPVKTKSKSNGSIYPFQAPTLSLYVALGLELIVWSPRPKKLASQIKENNKRTKCQILSSSLSISPAIQDILFGSEDFLDSLARTSCNVPIQIYVTNSIFNAVINAGKFDLFFSKLIEYEYQNVFDGVVTSKRFETYALVNKTLGTPFPEGGVNESYSLWTQARFSTCFLLKIFTDLFEDYFHSILDDIQKEVLEAGRLEIDDGYLSLEIKDEDKRQEIIMKSKEKLILFARRVIDALDLNISSQPGLLSTILNTIAKWSKFYAKELSRAERVGTGPGKILSLYFTSYFLRNINFRSVSRDQRRNISLVSEILQMSFSNEPQVYEIMNDWDSAKGKKQTTLSIVYKMCRQNGKPSSFDKNIQIDPAKYVHTARFIKNHVKDISPHCTTGTKKILSKVLADDTLFQDIGVGKKELEYEGDMDCFDEAAQQHLGSHMQELSTGRTDGEIESSPPPILYQETFHNQPSNFNSLNDWLSEELTCHSFTIVLVYRGLFCCWCKKYFKYWNKFYPRVLREGGLLVGLSSMNQTTSNENNLKWELSFPVIGEPENSVALSMNMKIKPWPGYPQGMAMPGLIVLDRKGEVIFHWACNPNFGTVFGAVDRPLPQDVLDQINDNLTDYEDEESTTLMESESISEFDQFIFE